MWFAGRKIDVNPQRLLVQRAKFSASVMVSAGVCYGSRGSLHFVPEKAKINADYYTNILLPKLIEDCNNVMPNGFIFQQDGAPAYTSRLAQDWLEQHSPDCIKKDEWPPNSPDLNPLDFHVWGAMLESTTLTCPSPRTKLNWRQFFKRSGTIFTKSPSTALFCRSEADFWRALELMAVTSSTYCSRKYHQSCHYQSALFRATTISRKNQSNTSALLG